MAVIRTKRDGGCSLCNASEANVGKRRCCHVLDNASIQVRHENGMNLIDISGNMNGEETSFSMKANETKIKNYIASLSDGLTKEEKAEILAVIKDE